MIIYRTKPDTVPLATKLDSSAPWMPPVVTSHPHPSIPQSTLVANVFREEECDWIIALTEALGYVPDEPDVVGTS